MNTVLLGGNLTESPDLRYTGSGTAVANATLATNERYKDSDGELQENTVFHDLVIWGPQAEVLSEYADKGQYIVVRGALQTNEWEDDDGNNRYDTEVKVLEFDFGPRGDSGSSPSSGSQEPKAEPAGEQTGEEEDPFEPDDELPF